jgi:hypothetical protein
MQPTTFRAMAVLAVIAALFSMDAMAQIAPTAGIYSVRTNADQAVSVPYALLIATGDGVNQVTITQAPGHGGLSFAPVVGSAGDAFLYTPAAGFVGIDTFIYKVRDQTGDFSVGSITINVGNVTATAGADDLIVGQAPNTFLDIFFNDLGFSDPVTLTILQSPTHGTLSITTPPSGWQSLFGIYYTASPGYTGPDQFQYRIGDGIDQGTATVDLTVYPDTDGDGVLDLFDNCPSVANPDQANSDGDVLGNACDTDDDNDGVLDTVDNCTIVANANQLNADGDAYGNICDPDLNNSGLVTSADFTLMRAVLNRSANFNAIAAAADMNGSGMVTSADFTLLRPRMNKVPGPSAFGP